MTQVAAMEVLETKTNDATRVKVKRTYSRKGLTASLVLGDQRTAAVARELDFILRDTGRSVGLATRTRSFVDGRQVEAAQPPTPDATKSVADAAEGNRQTRKGGTNLRNLLKTPTLTDLVCALSLGNVARRGVPLSVIDVAGLTSPGKKTNLELYEEAALGLARANPAKLVLSSRNGRGMKAAKMLRPEQVVLIVRGRVTKAVLRHLQAGGEAVIVTRDEAEHRLEYRRGDEVLLSLTTFGGQSAADGGPLASETGRRSRRIGVRIFAVAMACALGLTVEDLNRAMASAPVVN